MNCKRESQPLCKTISTGGRIAALALLAGATALSATGASAGHGGWFGHKHDDVTSFSLKKGDSNGDGVLDRAESEALAERIYHSVVDTVGSEPVDKDAFVRAMTEKRAKHGRGWTHRLFGGDKDKSHKHGKKCARREHQPREWMERLFGRLDFDSDGVVTESDIKSAGAQYFANADADANGQLNHEEIRNYRKQLRQERRAEKRARHFERMDADGDQLLSLEEYLAH